MLPREKIFDEGEPLPSGPFDSTPSKLTSHVADISKNCPDAAEKLMAFTAGRGWIPPLVVRAASSAAVSTLSGSKITEEAGTDIGPKLFAG